MRRYSRPTAVSSPADGSARRGRRRPALPDRTCASRGAGGRTVYMAREPRVAVERKRPWPDRPFDGASPSGDRSSRPSACPARTIRSGRCTEATSPIPFIARTERLSTLMPARRQKTFNARMYTASRSSSSRDALTSMIDVRPTGWWGQALGSTQPVSRPARGERPGSRVRPQSADDPLQARQQDLLDRALDRPQRERRFDCAISALIVVGEQGLDQRTGVRRQRRTSARNGRGDRVPFLERRLAAPLPRRGDKPDAHPASAAGGESRIAAPTLSGCSARRPVGPRLRSS